MNLGKSKRHNYCTVNVTMIVLFKFICDEVVDRIEK